MLKSQFLKAFLLIALVSPGVASADAPAEATINLVATVPNTCSLVVKGGVDALSLGEAIRTESLERFSVPVQVECNTPNAKLRARPEGLTSSAAPGYKVYYHVNTSLGIANSMGWINTDWQQPGIMGVFTEPIKQEIYVLIEGFRETNNKALPAGNYSGYVHLTLGAE